MLIQDAIVNEEGNIIFSLPELHNKRLTPPAVPSVDPAIREYLPLLQVPVSTSPSIEVVLAIVCFVSFISEHTAYRNHHFRSKSVNASNFFPITSNVPKNCSCATPCVQSGAYLVISGR
jgi:hypothetical protein